MEIGRCGASCEVWEGFCGGVGVVVGKGFGNVRFFGQIFEDFLGSLKMC